MDVVVDFVSFKFRYFNGSNLLDSAIREKPINLLWLVEWCVRVS